MTSFVFAATAIAASTAVNPKHPLLIDQTENAGVIVYFIRPDAGFRGVMGRAVSIRMDGEELLKLAKGEYTLVHMKPWTVDIVVKSSTVVMSGGMNAMIAVEESRPFTFAAGEMYYVFVSEAPRSFGGGSSFVPASMNREQAVEAAAGLAATGNAEAAPLTR
jgi:hypothetical protein